MLKAFFHWLDFHPTAYWYAPACSVPVIVWWIISAAQRERASHSSTVRRGDLWATAILLFLYLLAWRWPFLLSAVEYNPDESQFIAGAITLTHDPVYWRSVDGTTSGPLNIYALLPLHWAGFPLDYFSARLTALLLVWIALLACYRAVASNYGDFAARLGMLPLLVFFSVLHDRDYVHYSSEHVPLALIALSFCFLAESQKRRSLGFLFTAGTMAGLLPWAKLQSAPLGVGLVILGCWTCLKVGSGDDNALARKRKTAVFISGAALPGLMLVAITAGFGQWDIFLNHYLLQNLFYLESGGSFLETVMTLVKAAQATRSLPFFILPVLLVLAFCFFTQARRRRWPNHYLIGSVALTLIALACVVAPRRGSFHYTLLLSIPLGLSVAFAVGELLKLRPLSRHWIGLTLFFFAAILPWTVRFNQGTPDLFGQFGDHWRRPRSALGNVLHGSAQPGDQLAVWGWFARAYVESGLPQASRMGETYWAITPSPWQGYYRTLFLNDLKHSRPAFFVDAVGPEGFYFRDRTGQAHETFPELRDYVRQNYVLLTDVRYARAYCRRDLMVRNARSIETMPVLIAAGREVEDITNVPVEDLTTSGLPQKEIARRQVRMMLPPAKIDQPLDGSEKELMFEWGYDPLAWAAGQGNGTELTVWLETPGDTPVLLYRHLLNPAHVPNDRQYRTVQIDLPAIKEGSRLRLETDPGEYKDTSWDWAYVTQIRYRRGPLYTYQANPTDKDRRHASNGNVTAILNAFDESLAH